MNENSEYGKHLKKRKESSSEKDGERVPNRKSKILFLFKPRWLYKSNQPHHNMVFNPKVNTLQSRILRRQHKH